MFIKKEILNTILTTQGETNKALNNLNSIIDTLKDDLRIIDKEFKRFVLETEAKLFELKYPNGKYNSQQIVKFLGSFIYRDTFQYSYNNYIYFCKLPEHDLDYTKINDGYIFVNKERNRAYLLRFTQEECISIPYPCVC